MIDLVVVGLALSVGGAAGWVGAEVRVWRRRTARLRGGCRCASCWADRGWGEYERRNYRYDFDWMSWYDQDGRYVRVEFPTGAPRADLLAIARKVR